MRYEMCIAAAYADQRGASGQAFIAATVPLVVNDSAELRHQAVK